MGPMPGGSSLSGAGGSCASMLRHCLALVVVGQLGSFVSGDTYAANYIAPNFTAGTLRINSGGGAINDSFGRPWLADQDFNNSGLAQDVALTSNNNQTLASRSDNNTGLLDTIRTWPYNTNNSYLIPITPATNTSIYAVRLLFAELTFVNPALRSFNVTINGFQVLVAFNVLSDPFMLSFQEFSYPFPANVTTIEIVFSRVQGDPYVNAIEVVPLPEGQYRQNFSSSVGPVILQFVYRIIMGTNADSVDSLGRLWGADDPTIYTNPNTTVVTYNGTAAIGNTDVAPQDYGAFIYQHARIITSGNLTTEGLSLPISVAINGWYLVVLHFVELVYNNTGDRILDIYLQGVNILPGLDVVAKVGPNTAYWTSHLVEATAVSNGISLEILPNTTSSNKEPMLSGFELYYVQYEVTPTTPGSKLSSGALAGIIVGAVIAVLAVLALLFLWWYQGHVERNYWRAQGPGGALLGALQERQVRFIPLKEINSATNKFSEANKLGAGGFGTVYRGEWQGRAWAVKRANKASQTSLPDFTNEVDLISQLNHVNLVRLLGFCTEKGEQIFVYEFCDQGTVSDHLHARRGVMLLPLPFKRRLDIAVGAARGLNYLHSFAKEPVIHRDIKSDNILLDTDFTAKVADFGLLKKIETEPTQAKTVKIAGTRGYLDPEYYATFQVTDRSDVYSFGVVLLELLTGRPPILLNKENPDDTKTLVAWCRPLVAENRFQEMADPTLDDFPVEAFQKVAELALACCKPHGHQRPAMAAVVRALERVYFGEGATREGGIARAGSSDASSLPPNSPQSSGGNWRPGSRPGSQASPSGGSVQMMGQNSSQNFSEVIPR